MSPQPFEVNYQSLFEDSPLAITLLNSNGDVVEINTMSKDIYGVERDLIINKHFTELFIAPDENIQEIKKIFKEVLTGKKYGSIDIQILTQKGGKIWINIVASLIQVGDNQLIQVLTQDINKRKLLERRIEVSERRYRGLYESSPLSLTLTDSHGIILDVNSATEKIIGFKKSEVIGKKYFDLGIYSPEQVERFRKDYKESLKGKKIGPIELQIKRKDGTIAWLNIQNSLKKIDNEFLVEGIAQDITERKMAQEKIKESEEKYRLLAENANALITVVNLDFKIEYINKEAHKKIMGYSSEEILNHNAMDFVHPEDRDTLLKAYNQRGDFIEARIKHKDGHYVWTETSGKYFNDKNGKNKVLTISRDISERKEWAQKLIESQKKYKDLANSLPEVIFEIDLNFKLTYTNTIASQIFGYSHEDFKKGLNIFNFISPEEKELVLEKLSHIFKGKLIEPLILQLRKKDGSFFYGTINATPIFKGSKIVGMRSIVHDVTEMINAEEKIKESEAKFRTISEQSLMGISIIQDDRVKYVNKTFANMLGYSNEEILNWSPGEFFKTIYFKDKKRIIELSAEIINRIEKGVSYYEARGIHKNGNIIWLEIYSKAIMYQKKPAFLVSIIDISERKKAKEELKKSEVKYRFLFENSPSSMLLIDTSGNIEDCNPALEKLIEYNKTELIGKKFSNLSFIFPKYIPHLLKRLKQISDGETIPPIDIQLIKKNGSLIWVNYDSSLVKIGDKKYIMVMGHNISVQKEAEEKLKELDGMRQEFIDRASHELKTPITTVYGAYQILNTLYKHKFGAEELELLEMAFSGTKRLKKLVDELLDVSKLESRMLILDKTEINLSELINDCVIELKYFIKKRNQEIELKIPDKLMINVDRLRIELVLTNLLTNSIKYTPVKGKISVNLVKRKEYAEISIKDTGIGLTKSQIKKLFKKFTKIPNPYNDKMEIDLGSTGLGLHISKAIVELHDGTITVKSTGKNKGSTFIVRLPFQNN
ncbi:MAG: PAS domain S-box protein [Promethearchaeota archaeon]